MYRIEFTGPFAELKTLGFEFQRLYAMNYMQWHHEPSQIRVWKKGRDVTCNQLPDDMLAQVLLFLEHNQTFNKARIGDYYHAYWNTIDKHVSQRSEAYEAAQVAENTPFPQSWQHVPIHGDTMAMLIKLKELRWIQAEKV